MVKILSRLGVQLLSEPWNARVRLFSTFAPLYDETNLKMQMFFCYLDKILRALMSAFCCFNQLAQNVREGCQRVAIETLIIFFWRLGKGKLMCSGFAEGHSAKTSKKPCFPSKSTNLERTRY